jgi:hypothetical protein
MQDENIVLEKFIFLFCKQCRSGKERGNNCKSDIKINGPPYTPWETETREQKSILKGLSSQQKNKNKIKVRVVKATLRDIEINGKDIEIN